MLHTIRRLIAFVVLFSLVVPVPLLALISDEKHESGCVNNTLAPNALVLAETQATSAPLTLSRLNVWGPGGLVSTGPASASSRLYPLTDHLGSTRFLTDSAGNVVQAYTYTPYGSATSTMPSATTSSPYQFAGEQYDPETGLTYLRARYYDPTTGRFIARDPVRGTLDNPITQNPFIYAASNPTTYTDPSGEFIPLLIAWGVLELGLTLYDAYGAYNTLADPCASPEAKALASSLFVAGLVGPGGGYGSVDDIAKLVNKFGKISGGQVSSGKVLDIAERWLGPGYKEIAPGVYRSADNQRQFRMTSKDLGEGEFHLESIDPDGREIMENAHYLIVD